MTNAHVNKVIYDGNTLIDLTDATATADKILAGYTAYGADGSLIVGTAVAEDSMKYAVCSTAASTQIKAVTVSGITELTEGLSLRVKFSNAQSYAGVPKLNLNTLGDKYIRRLYGTNAAQYEWAAGAVVDMVYDGTYWIIVGGGAADTTYYGKTKLSSATDSSSTALAATPSAVKAAYDKPDAMLNRTTNVNAADANYTALMARGESLNTAETTPAVNGAICWTYE